MEGLPEVPPNQVHQDDLVFLSNCEKIAGYRGVYCRELIRREEHRRQHLIEVNIMGGPRDGETYSHDTSTGKKLPPLVMKFPVLVTATACETSMGGYHYYHLMSSRDGRYYYRYQGEKDR